MTAVERNIVRETECTDRGRNVMVQLFPRHVRVWVKGKHESHLVPWDAVLDLGRKLDFERKGRRA
jgi:hypothetical protein